MSDLYNIEVTQGTNQPVVETDVYNEETLLFYLNRFGVVKYSDDYNRLIAGERLLITTYKEQPLSIRLIPYFSLNKQQKQLVTVLKICAGVLVATAFILITMLHTIKILIILMPNALLLWFTSKKLETTSSEKFEEVTKRVLTILVVSMIVFSLVAYIII
ncbi:MULTISPECIES: hypothetical protein [unclassified Acinetobacter]|uniref:hypothetical protein n=1 Tax=unclassified Acinetobacter TaxID=196816 RepID=UPI0015D111F0|nr:MULTISPECIES: hypothetical protein [unclassified Acinetobacter]UUS62512.1 hypothetical protein MST17_16800 [Acinetobacter sp. YH16056_T]